MRRRVAWLVGAVVAAVVALRALGRRHRSDGGDAMEDAPVATDERAEELRRRLDEARGMAEERDAFEEGEVPIDQAEPDPDERRRRVHAEGRAAVDEMQQHEPGPAQ